MTDLPQVSSGAKTIKHQAAEWLMERRFAENWSTSDEARLQDWIGQSLAHRVAFVRLESAWSRTNRLAALRSVRRASEHQENGNPILRRVVASLGALVVVGAVVGGVLLTPRDTTYTTSIGGHEVIRLADGSRVELNTDTQLRVGARERTATLERGEAYFQIKHNSAHPFVVLANDHRIVDLGTKFVVRAGSGHLEVGLVEGSARLESASAWGQPHTAVLKPGDVALATAASLSVKSKPQKVLIDTLGWRDGVIIFDHATLADAVSEFNRYNRLKLVVGDSAAARLKIYGTFRADNIEDFVRLAKDIFGLRAEHRNDEIVIFR